MFEVREVLRLCLRGEGPRPIERRSALGFGRRGDPPPPLRRHGEAWRVLATHHDRIKAWLDNGLTTVKVHDLSTREGVTVPERTLHRYALEECVEYRAGDQG